VVDGCGTKCQLDGHGCGAWHPYVSVLPYHLLIQGRPNFCQSVEHAAELKLPRHILSIVILSMANLRGE